MNSVVDEIQVSNKLIQQYRKALQEPDVPGRNNELRRSMLARGIEYHQERIEKLKAALSSPEADDGIDE